jgi:sugar lactone lactonase YvrE
MKFWLRTCILFFLFWQYTSHSYAQIITTVAGSAVAGYSGDGEPATMATILGPSGVVADKHNNLYIADNDNNRIRRVDAITGIITTIAGNGSYGFAGDGGPAISASLKAPTGIAIDATGNLYIADYYNCRIRKVDIATGFITTIAGNGSVGYSGDGGPAVSATIWLPTGVAVDGSNNVYIADLANSRVRKVDAITGIISTVAGNGIAGFSGDGGLAISAELYEPYGISVDAAKNLYITDYGNNNIRKLATSTGIISTVAGTGIQGYNGDGLPGLSTNLTAPTGITVDIFGNLYIADLSQRVLRMDAITGIITTIAGNGTQGFSGDGGPARNAQLFNSWAVFININGDLFIGDLANNRVRKVAFCFNPVISSLPENATTCVGGNAHFKIRATSAISYQWQINTPLGWQNLINGPSCMGANTDSISLINVGFALNGSEYRCEISNGCINLDPGPDTLIVAVSLTPSVVIKAAATAVCRDSATEFTAIPTNGGGIPSFQWQVNGFVTETGVASYTNNHLRNGDIVSCLMTSSATCAVPQTAMSNSIPISVNPETLPFLGKDTIICKGNSIVLYPGAFRAYAWSNLENTDSIIVADAGIYWVQVTDQNNCKAIDSIQVSIASQCNCILDEKTKIYPTPFHDFLIIDKQTTDCDVSMSLYNTLGQALIRNKQIQNGTNKINLSAIAAGMYFCVFRAGNKVLRSEKILKVSWKY